MDNTPNLELPYLMAAQAQKHVTHNEAIRMLDAVVQLSVKDRGLTTPPGSPVDGDRHIVKTSATGAWEGKDNQIAAYQDNAWGFYAPQEGWMAWVADEDRLYVWDGALWNEVTSDTSEIQNANHVGINATADDTNRLTVSSPATLLNHEGNGHQLKINKNAVADTASMLFQTNWSGRAEFGLNGDDDWHVKTSQDGASWHEALIADKDDGAVAFPSGTRHTVSGASTSMLIQTPGGSGEVTFWRQDAARSGFPRQATISSVSGDVINLTDAKADQFFVNSYMEDVSYVRIWNISKSPDESAWIRRYNSSTSLNVTDATHISGWLNGETLQIGEPMVSPIATNVAAIDISPMLQNRLGAVFRQSALMVGLTASADAVQAQLSVSPTGANGGHGNLWTGADGLLAQVQYTITTTELSPISNSNLIFLRERDYGAGTLRVSHCKIFGVWV